MGKAKQPKFGKRSSVIEVEYKELNELVQKVYKDKDYCFVSVQECGNDSQHTFTVKGQVEHWMQDVAKQIRNGNVPTYNNYTLMECLAEDGHIEPGEYIISVCW